MIERGSEQERDGMGTASGHLDRDLTDDELIEVWESTTAGVSDGTLPTFSDRGAFLQDLFRRLGR